MRGLAVVGVLLGACDPAGLTLEVIVSDPAIDTVELFIGNDCADCPEMMGAPMLTRRAADIYTMSDDAMWSAPVDGDRAGFRLVADTEQTLGVIIAVGLIGDRPVATATLHDVVLEAQAPVYVKIELGPATDLVDPTTVQPDGTERIARWRHPDQTLPSCVMVEHWKDGAAKRDVVVPDTDRDCDRIDRAAECAPYVPNAMLPPSQEDVSCLLTQPVLANDVCMIGGKGCSEATGPNTCQSLAENYCTPRALCGCSDAPDLFACVRDRITDDVATGAMPYLKCTLPTELDGSPCALLPSPTLDVSPYLVVNNVASCDAIRVRTTGLPFGPFATSAPLGTATLNLVNFASTCKVEVALSGMYTPNAPGVHRELLIAEIDLINGKHLVVPFIVDVSPGDCDGVALNCSPAQGYSTTETMFDCVR